MLYNVGKEPNASPIVYEPSRKETPVIENVGELIDPEGVDQLEL
jgi:hypothetical protein